MSYSPGIPAHGEQPSSARINPYLHLRHEAAVCRCPQNRVIELRHLLQRTVKTGFRLPEIIGLNFSSHDGSEIGDSFVQVIISHVGIQGFFITCNGLLIPAHVPEKLAFSSPYGAGAAVREEFGVIILADLTEITAEAKGFVIELTCAAVLHEPAPQNISLEQ